MYVCVFVHNFSINDKYPYSHQAIITKLAIHGLIKTNSISKCKLCGPSSGEKTFMNDTKK